MARRLNPANIPTDTPSIGPSDSSDSGSDLVGIPRADDTSDRNATGERLDVEGDTRDAEDIDMDRIVSEREAGLGGGLDQAEEAQLGITDEEIEDLERDPEE